MLISLVLVIVVSLVVVIVMLSHISHQRKKINKLVEEISNYKEYMKATSDLVAGRKVLIDQYILTRPLRDGEVSNTTTISEKDRYKFPVTLEATIVAVAAEKICVTAVPNSIKVHDTGKTPAVAASVESFFKNHWIDKSEAIVIEDDSFRRDKKIDEIFS